MTMEPDFLISVLVSSISGASILLIASIGLAVVFGLMGVINLAHGEFIMFGAYAALYLHKLGIPFWLAVIPAALITGVFGAIVERLIIQRLYGRLLDTLLATWGLSLILYQSAVLIFGTVTPGIGMSRSNVQIGNYAVSSYLLFLIGVAAFLTAAVYWLLTRTNYGIMARAVVQDREIALTVGIESKRLNMLTFSLGSALAGFAGAILLPVVPVTPGMGSAFVTKAFLAVVVAGPVSLTGTVLATGILGTAANTLASFFSTVFGDVAFFLMAVFILRIFPNGISGKWKLKL